jgi:hypothetical protein
MNLKRWLGLTSLILLALMTLTYWGYCWGWWGRTNLVLQYLFQCNCPTASENARYSPLKVLFSACTAPELRAFSPNGRFLILYQQGQPISFDTETQQIQKLGPGRYRFLTDDLALIYEPRQWHLLDWRDQTRLPLTEIKIYDKPLNSEQKESLRKAERLFLVGNEIVVVAQDFKKQNAPSLIFTEMANILQTLKQEGIAYTIAPEADRNTKIERVGEFYNALYAHPEQLWADKSGIYQAQTQQRITPDVRAYDKNAYGWINRDRAVVYGLGSSTHLFGGSEGFGFYPSLFPVPLPILVLEVPPEYWPK